MPGKMRLGATTGNAARRRGGSIAAAVLFLIVAALLCPSPLSAQKAQSGAAEADRPVQTVPEPKIRDIAEQAIRRLDLQTELVRRPEPLVRQLQLPPEVLWLVVIVGIAVLLYAFRDLIPALRAGRDGAWTPEEAAGAELGAQPAEIALGAADGLAAQGRFAEAIHVLLLQALAVIRRRLDEPFADSMTSREILRSKHLPDDMRRPLREVVGRVEWSYFGEHPAARGDYAACRASFAALAHALGRGAAA